MVFFTSVLSLPPTNRRSPSLASLLVGASSDCSKSESSLVTYLSKVVVGTAVEVDVVLVVGKAGSQET